MKYTLSYSENENSSTVETYKSLIKWLMRIVKLLKEGKSVLIYKM